MKIKASVLRDICYRENDADEFKPYDEWEFIKSTITGNDTDDGGASYKAIVKNTITGEFYKANYNDWDFYWEYSDFETDEEEGENEGRTIDNGEMMEIYPVKAKQKTITTYE